MITLKSYGGLLMFSRFMDGLSLILIPELGFFFGILTAVFLVVTVTMCVAGLFTRLLDFIASLTKKPTEEQLRLINQIKTGPTFTSGEVRENLVHREASAEPKL